MRHRLAILAVLVISVMALAGSALAQGSAEPPPQTGPNTQPRVEERGTPDVAGEGNVLPLTGGDLSLFVLAGGLTVAVGATLVRRARVRDAQL